MNDSLLVARSIGMASLSFLIAAFLMPLLIRVLKRLGMGKSIRDAASAPVMAALHEKKAGTPTMGGMVIWGTVLLVTLLLAAGCQLAGPVSLLCRISFLSRGQTWLPLGLMIAAALIGLVDDYLNVKHRGPNGGGLRMRQRLLSYILVSAIGAWWFYTKLDWNQIHLPFMGTFQIGLWYVPFFMLTITATSHSVNVTDGLDGLAGGSLLAAFGAYAVIAWSQGRTDLATLCMAIIGALLGFLWFNVHPARVFMGDTGSMSLGTVLGVVALMTNQPFLLLVIGLPFVLESLSVLVQWISKITRHGKKIFKSSPLHHHLEAIGWSEPAVVMRFWMVSFVCAGFGVVLAIIDHA
ncbi:MAG: phospho-N-acetylmuramoyl-pentapeptide-transferase [Candidatus Uhrbacteria bacterium]|nr:phospho-N-acetylmuramoyl-pentapeptide-transferase [Candidatus Uhrbacteria bacterium]